MAGLMQAETTQDVKPLCKAGLGAERTGGDDVRVAEPLPLVGGTIEIVAAAEDPPTVGERHELGVRVNAI